MKIEFGKFTEVTKLAKEVAPEMFDIYEKVYICPDTLNWWIIGIQKDMNDEYEAEEGTWLCERADIEYPSGRCKPFYLSMNHARNALEEFDGCLWDNFEASSLEEAIEQIDGGCGINPEEE